MLNIFPMNLALHEPDIKKHIINPICLDFTAGLDYLNRVLIKLNSGFVAMNDVQVGMVTTTNVDKPVTDSFILCVYKSEKLMKCIRAAVDNDLLPLQIVDGYHVILNHDKKCLDSIQDNMVSFIDEMGLVSADNIASILESCYNELFKDEESDNIGFFQKKFGVVQEPASFFYGWNYVMFPNITTMAREFEVTYTNTTDCNDDYEGDCDDMIEVGSDERCSQE